MFRMKTLTINKANFSEILQIIVENINKWWEIKIIVNEENTKLDSETEKKRYKNTINPKKWEFDIIKKQFIDSNEAIDFLRN